VRNRRFKKVPRGKFVVLYGANGTGKSTQVNLLVERLEQEGYPATKIKYPIYQQKPDGELINEYLREGNPLKFSPREFQLLQVINRWHFQPTLQEMLRAGITVVAEDYIGTGLAWGMVFGLDRKTLMEFNQGLLREDLAVLLDGKPMGKSEINHTHESSSALIKKVRSIFLELSGDFNWPVVNANLPREEVAETIWQKVKPIFEI